MSNAQPSSQSKPNPSSNDGVDASVPLRLSLAEAKQKYKRQPSPIEHLEYKYNQMRQDLPDANFERLGDQILEGLNKSNKEIWEAEASASDGRTISSHGVQYDLKYTNDAETFFQWCKNDLDKQIHLLDRKLVTLMDHREERSDESSDGGLDGGS